MSDKKIPKIIHYCWFGRNPKPDVIKKCIASWEKYCPDWEIKEWNEENFDITVVPYMKEAYEAKNWAFVSDVARLLVVYQSGGVYLDTDVELLRPIDELLNNNAFFAFETSRNIASGLGFGAIKEEKTINKMIQYYKDKNFLINGVQQLIPCPAGNTEALKSCYPEFQRNGLSQRFEGIRILSGKEYSQYAIHHGTGTWLTGPRAKKQEYHLKRIKSILRNPQYFEKVENIFGKKGVNIYTWIVYDLQEYGIIFYIKKLIYKIIKKD